MADRLNLGSGAPWEASAGYCRVVRRGPQVWVSGTVALGEDGEPLVGAGAYAEARRCLEIIAAALEKAGAGLEDVVRTRMYVTDIGDWQAVARAHGEVFGRIRPATTLVSVAALIAPEFSVEIEAEAWIEDATGVGSGAGAPETG